MDHTHIFSYKLNEDIDRCYSNKQPRLVQTKRSGFSRKINSDPGLWSDERKVHQHQSKIITFRSTNTLDEKKLNEDLKQLLRTSVKFFDDINDKDFICETLFQKTLDKHLPKKQMKVR